MGWDICYAGLTNDEGPAVVLPWLALGEGAFGEGVLGAGVVAGAWVAVSWLITEPAAERRATMVEVVKCMLPVCRRKVLVTVLFGITGLLATAQEERIVPRGLERNQQVEYKIGQRVDGLTAYKDLTFQ